MSFLKVAILLAATLAVTCAFGTNLEPDKEINAMVKKVFWDPKAIEASPGAAPYTLCDRKMVGGQTRTLAGGQIYVIDYAKSSTGPSSGVTYKLNVDLQYPASGSDQEWTQGYMPITIHKAKNGKLTVKDACGRNG